MQWDRLWEAQEGGSSILTNTLRIVFFGPIAKLYRVAISFEFGWIASKEPDRDTKNVRRWINSRNECIRETKTILHVT